MTQAGFSNTQPRLFLRLVLLVTCMIASSHGETGLAKTDMTAPIQDDFNASDQLVEPGVSWDLATHRKKQISAVNYDLNFALQKTGPIQASITIGFSLNATDRPVILDFNAPAKNIQRVTCNGKETAAEIRNGHLIVPSEFLQTGDNKVVIKFVAGEQSLNRNEEFLYTLLVPDRASTVFPCFDQPDLKARFGLQLSLPPDWVASANGRLSKTESGTENRKRLTFRKTKPISTYLFAFAAGKFQTVTRRVDGYEMTLFHRENDLEKVDRNLDDIFQIHAISLNWMEKYTAIDYPFDKFAFVLIPSFQYGGMEHVGNIFYNANSLFLEKSATKSQKLNRASLIAHETAHMWFGDLVTMKWFDDVWLKEVFANFMAAKIVHPAFPEINHDLGFLLKHHPSAYGEDRTRGTHPIQQRLDNLRNAGTLYGRIIYTKAPVVMRQLETIIGPEQLRNGLREYLNNFCFDNAVWDDLIDILDKKTEVDLKTWSETWVKESGAPEIETSRSGPTLTIKQLKQTEKQKYWVQQIDIKVVSDGKTRKKVRTLIGGKETAVQLPELQADFDFYLINGSELGYGFFRLDEKSKQYLLSHAPEIEDDVTRGAAWLALYESMVRGEIPPLRFYSILQSGIQSEQEPLNRQNLLSQLSTVYWKFMSPAQRRKVAPRLESILWKWVESDSPADAKSSYYKTLVQVALTEGTINRLYEVWKTESDIDSLPLAEADYMNLAYELAIRLPDQAADILQTQLQRLKNDDRKKRFQYVIPALMPDPSTRDAFFERLKQKENRRPERWVLEALQYLHHPTRAKSAEKYIRPSLEMLEEIQLTGDIFFPKRWLTATLSGHQSPSAAQAVKDFLDAHPDYPFRLKNKILQAADLLFKAADQRD